MAIFNSYVKLPEGSRDVAEFAKNPPDPSSFRCRSQDQRPYITIRINDKLKVAPVALLKLCFPVETFVQIA